MIYNSDYKRREDAEGKKQAKTVDIVSLSLYISMIILIGILILKG